MGKFVGRTILDTAVDAPVNDNPNSGQRVQASDAIEGANDIRKAGEQSKHAENVEAINSEYEAFLRKRDEIPGPEDDERSVVFRTPDPGTDLPPTDPDTPRR